MATSNKLLLYAGLGLGAYLLYKKYAAPAAAAPSTGQLVAVPQVDPVTEYPGVDLSTGQASAPPTGIAVPNGIDPTVYGVVLAWLQRDADPAMSVMGVNPIPSEFNGLYNIIQNNLWGTPQVADFWNALYAKYHP